MPDIQNSVTQSARGNVGHYPGADAPYYVPIGNEIDVFTSCHASGLPVMLRGPTGCGKTRFVEHMAWRLKRPFITIVCHDDLSASDLTGRYLIRGGETVWADGPLTVAARIGAICYLDELVEARQDTVVVTHALSDDRKVLPIDKTGELVQAATGFQLVASYNPGYQHAIKDLKLSTRQRFVTLEFEFPSPSVETEIVAHERQQRQGGRIPVAHLWTSRAYDTAPARPTPTRITEGRATAARAVASQLAM